MAGLLNIDLNRPKIQNPDGSFSTERTITIDANGRWYNIPTIVNGQELDPRAAIELWSRGINKHVGEYGSLQEAETAARERSNAIGLLRRNK